jgi:nicotinic acid mononucleotide adenylyltransferase
LIVGSDAAATLAGWHQPETIRRLATLVVAERLGMVPASETLLPATRPSAQRNETTSPAEGALTAAIVEKAYSLGQQRPALPPATTATEAVLRVSWPGVAASSSDIRARLGRGAPIGYLLPSSVARLIAEHQPYRH